MNFFEHQNKARSNTNLLVAFFVLAVILIILIVNIAIAVSFGFSELVRNLSLETFISLFDWQSSSLIALGVITFITVAILLKKSELSDGGVVIANKLGGRLVCQSSIDLKERILLNIVEEMSIASGVPVPLVFIIDEEGINAFAAGFDINDAVIGITEGALRYLNRDELQGVIAHEFSHIFNGDMRLNITLISVLHGIIVIGLSGHYILHSSFESRRYRYRGRDGGSSQIELLGLCLAIIGSVGTFFGNIIKGSISRQREYLADASAVQFTRNPSGIATALKKIGSLSEGSTITNAKAEELSHMFFAKSSSSYLNSLMATHPPLVKRILTIEPRWDQKFPELKPITLKSQHNVTSHTKHLDVKASNIAGMIATIGHINQKSIDQAHDLIIGIPPVIKEATSNPFGARAVIYSLLIDKKDNTSYEKQLQILTDHADKAVTKLANSLHVEIGELDSKFRLPLIDLSIPTLKLLSLPQYKVFKANIELLIKADAKVSLFEWSLMKILFNNLDRGFKIKDFDGRGRYNLYTLKYEVSLFLSIMAYTGGRNEKAAEQIFQSTINENLLVKFPFIAKSEIKMSALDKAITKLVLLKPLEKEKLLKACSMCITQNNISQSETELLRAFSAILNCPMPLVAK